MKIINEIPEIIAPALNQGEGISDCRSKWQLLCIKISKYRKCTVFFSDGSPKNCSCHH